MCSDYSPGRAGGRAAGWGAVGRVSFLCMEVWVLQASRAVLRHSSMSPSCALDGAAVWDLGCGAGVLELPLGFIHHGQSGSSGSPGGGGPDPTCSPVWSRGCRRPYLGTWKCRVLGPMPHGSSPTGRGRPGASGVRTSRLQLGFSILHVMRIAGGLVK